MLSEQPIPDELVFTTTTKPTADRQRVDLSLDGHPLVAYRPKDAILGMLTTAASRDSGIGDMVLALTQFLRAALDEDSFRHVNARLTDPGDPLELDPLVSIMEALIGRWLPDAAADLGLSPNGVNRAARRAKR